MNKKWIDKGEHDLTKPRHAAYGETLKNKSRCSFFFLKKSWYLSCSKDGNKILPNNLDCYHSSLHSSADMHWKSDIQATMRSCTPKLSSRHVFTRLSIPADSSFLLLPSVHYLVLELFLEVLLLGSEVRHCSVEVPRLLLVVLALHLFCGCLPTLHTSSQVDWPHARELLALLGSIPACGLRGEVQSFVNHASRHHVFAWLTGLELHGALLWERRCPSLQARSWLFQEERWSWFGPRLLRDVSLWPMGRASLCPGGVSHLPPC